MHPGTTPRRSRATAVTLISERLSLRQIGKLPKELAPEPFHDHLLAMGVKSRIDLEPDGHPIWIYNEDHVETARRELALYLADPDNPRYQSAKIAAQVVRQRDQALDRAYRKNARDVADLWTAPRLRQRPLTMALILISIVVFVLEQSRKGQVVIDDLSIATSRLDKRGEEFDDGLAGLRSGELWRLVTPIFIHFGLLHIFFNMSAMNVLSTLIEIRRGTGRLLVLVLITAVVSNLGQYYYMEHMQPGMVHSFGGMSGVLYGLFGYLWMKTLHEPEQGMILNPQSVMFGIAWLILCMTGVFGPIANAAHVTGLAAGVVLGILRF